MKIAIPYQNGQVFPHFGHAPQFKFYTIESGMILHTEVVETAGSGHSAVTAFLMRGGVDTLICGSIGAGAQTAVAGANIRLYAGVSGDADKAVLALLAGKLVHDPTAVHCGHHDGEHHCGGQEYFGLRLSKNICRGEHCSPVPTCLTRKLSRKMRCGGKLTGDQWSPLHTQQGKTCPSPSPQKT